jgi:3-dehydroquinate dehydratase II
MSLQGLRQRDTPWKIIVLSGPNVSAAVSAVGDFDERLAGWAADLGVHMTHFASNHEGRILEHIHATYRTANGYLVNPGGLTRIGESLRHALRDAKRPHVEVHFDNAPLARNSLFSPSVTAIVGGLGSSSYLAALVALVLGLDDEDFLHPDGTSEISRPHGAPRSLYQ